MRFSLWGDHNTCLEAGPQLLLYCITNVCGQVRPAQSRTCLQLPPRPSKARPSLCFRLKTSTLCNPPGPLPNSWLLQQHGTTGTVQLSKPGLWILYPELLLRQVASQQVVGGVLPAHMDIYDLEESFQPERWLTPATTPTVSYPAHVHNMRGRDFPVPPSVPMCLLCVAQI